MIHTMKCLFETNNESGHHFLTMSRFIPWSAYLRLIMSQGIVFTQCHDSYHEVLILRLMSQGIVSSQCHYSPPHPVSFTSLTQSFLPGSLDTTLTHSRRPTYTPTQSHTHSLTMHNLYTHPITHPLTPHAQTIHPPTHSPYINYTPTQSLPMHKLYTHPITHPFTPHAQPIHPPNHTPTHSPCTNYTPTQSHPQSLPM